MLVAAIAEKLELRTLQGDRLRDRGVLVQLTIELRDQEGRGLIVDEPERRQRGPGAGLDRHAREPERRAIVAGGGLARAESDEFDRLAAKLPRPDQPLEIVQGQPLVVREEVRVARVVLELRMRRDMHQRVLAVVKLLVHARETEL